MQALVLGCKGILLACTIGSGSRQLYHRSAPSPCCSIQNYHHAPKPPYLKITHADFVEGACRHDSLVQQNLGRGKGGWMRAGSG